MAVGRRPFGRDNLADKLFKLRGVLAVASVPLFLILAVVMLMPTAPSDDLDFSHQTHLPRPLDNHGDVLHRVNNHHNIVDALLGLFCDSFFDVIFGTHFLRF